MLLVVERARVEGELPSEEVVPCCWENPGHEVPHRESYNDHQVGSQEY